MQRFCRYALVFWVLWLLAACAQEQPAAVTIAYGDQAIYQAFEQKQQHYLVSGEGKVIKLLPDDNKGSRHQRFIIELKSTQTLLVAHNIDLAPRVDDLKVGDAVQFLGEYEWNKHGGVIHWTHHDPANKHEHGWLKVDGKVYQ